MSAAPDDEPARLRRELRDAMGTVEHLAAFASCVCAARDELRARVDDATRIIGELRAVMQRFESVYPSLPMAQVWREAVDDATAFLSRARGAGAPVPDLAARLTVLELREDADRHLLANLAQGGATQAALLALEDRVRRLELAAAATAAG